MYAIEAWKYMYIYAYIYKNVYIYMYVYTRKYVYASHSIRMKGASYPEGSAGEGNERHGEQHTEHNT